jgi:hypothetical protein
MRKTETGVTVEGVPLEVEFQPAVGDLRLFCDNLLSGQGPFKLWGIPEFLADDYATVRAVDLHVGHILMLEICPEFMRVYLPPHTCGNTILRLITNLQGHLDSRIQVYHEGVTLRFEIN